MTGLEAPEPPTLTPYYRGSTSLEKYQLLQYHHRSTCILTPAMTPSRRPRVHANPTAVDLHMDLHMDLQLYVHGRTTKFSTMYVLNI